MKYRLDTKSYCALLQVLILLTCLLSFSGCATTSQTVNREALEASRAKTFKLGVVKAGGAVYWDSGKEFKIQALKELPIEEIASTLKEAFGLNLDTRCDRTLRLVYEPVGRQHPGADNLFFGNLCYSPRSLLRVLLSLGPTLIEMEDLPDIVNVTYTMEGRLFSSELRYVYQIEAKSSGQEVLVLKGDVHTMPTPMKMFMVADVQKIWEEYVKHAGEMNDALKRDIAQANTSLLDSNPPHKASR